MRHPKFIYRKTYQMWTCLKILPALVISIMILVHTTDVFGNDSIARIDAGGITFEKSEDIRMLEEVLEISLKKIHVTYRFLNETDHDIHATVAFPFPSKKEFTRYLRPLQHRDKFIKTFRVTVDGNPVSTTASGEVAVFWKQSFPAGKETVVEHTYTPIAGGRYEVPYQEKFGYVSDVGSIDFLNDDPCLEAATKSEIVGRVSIHVGKGVGWVTLKDSDVKYILGTGRNWKGPIGTFRLRIERNFPDQFISVCFPSKGQQISPTVYEFVQRDFAPPDTLVVHFYTVYPSPDHSDDKISEDE